MASLSVFGRTVTDVLAIAHDARSLDVVELWSGMGHIAQAARRNKLDAATFDILDDFHDDITTEGGFMKASSSANVHPKDCGPDLLPFSNPQLATLKTCECRRCWVQPCTVDAAQRCHTRRSSPPPDIRKT